MMQAYRSHKLVHAGRIQGISYNAAGEPCRMQVGGKQYDVPNDILVRAPSLGVGDFLVLYEGGYLSVSPAAAFEAGYTLVEGDAAEGRDWGDLSQAEKSAVIDHHISLWRQSGGADDPVDPPCDVEGAPV